MTLFSTAPSELRAGMITLSSSQGGYVRGGSKANNNYGGGNLLVKNSGGGFGDYWYSSWIEFDTSALLDVTTASLNLSVIHAEAFDIVVNVYGLNDSAGEFWDQSTLTFNNRPSVGSALLGTSTVAGSTTGIWSDFSFAEVSLTNFLNADTNGKATLILTAQTVSHAHGITFAPDPVLSLQANVVPEPSSFAIFFGFGYLPLLSRRRTAIET